MRARSLIPCLALLGFAAGCSDAGSPGPAASGSVLVRILPTGSAPHAAAYRLTFDDSTFATTTADVVLLPQVAAGQHTVALALAEATCTPDWYVPQSVSVTSGDTATVTFSAQCDVLPAPGLIFASSRDNLARNLYRMDPTGANVQRLTTYALGDDHPAVSPGRTRVAFERQAQLGLPQVWLMDADGSHAKKLTSSSLLEQSPTWAPDGKHVAFIRWTDGDTRALILATPDGRSEKVLASGRLSFGTAISAPVWSPDGQSIAVARWDNTRFFTQLVDVASGAVRDFALPNDPLELSPLAWAPDGQLLLCRLHRQPESCDAVLTSVATPAGAVLATGLSGLVSATYSPDGGTIALTANGPSNGPFDVFRMTSGGANLTNLTNAPLSQDLGPSWLR